MLRLSGLHLLNILRFIALVFTLAILSAPRTSSAGEKPRLFVLAIGVDRYQDPSISELQYSVADAEAVIRWAEDQEGLYYGQVETRLLRNEEVTLPGVRGAVVEFFAPAGPGDYVLLYLAGHGEQTSDDYYFYTYDTEQARPYELALDGAFLSKVTSPSDRDRDRVMLWVDSCESGGLTTGSGTRGVTASADLSAHFDAPLDAELVMILTATSSTGGAEESPKFILPGDPESSPGHGLFTYSLLTELSSAANARKDNNLVYSDQLEAAVNRVVSGVSGGSQRISSGGYGTLPIGAVQTEEVCDGVDNNWDGIRDENCPDSDEDGTPDTLDYEECDKKDNDGDGDIDEGFDRDRDGYYQEFSCWGSYSPEQLDCDDIDPSIHPGQEDGMDDEDTDCDGSKDEDGILMLDQITALKAQRNIWLMVAGTSYTGAGLASATLLFIHRTAYLDCEGQCDAGVLEGKVRQAKVAQRVGQTMVLTGTLGVGLGFVFGAGQFSVQRSYNNKASKEETPGLTGAR